MQAYSVLVLAMLLSAVSFAKDCKKGSGKDMDNCLAQNSMKWAFPVDASAENLEKIISYPKIKKLMTEEEIKASTLFCQFYFHEFSSPGSAKFMCAKTTAEGVLLDSKGHPVDQAKSVSTRNMNLTTLLNGQTVKVDEGILLDANGRALQKQKKDGTDELVKAEELKIKYFIDRSQFNEAGIKRETVQLPLGEKTIPLENAFVGPLDVSVARWNEVFTEVASTRLFSLLGLPADVVIPVKQVVCFGCDSHAKDQKVLSLGRISIYRNAVLERKYEGTKLGEQFSLNRVTARNLPDYKPEVQYDYEALALGLQLIAYHHAISLQNRLQCADGAYDKATNICTTPVGLVQDLGSSWGGSAEGDNRGILSLYSKGKVFKDASTCELFYKVGSDRPREMLTGRFLENVSPQGLEKFKERSAHITPELIRAILTVARYGDVQPSVRDAAPGNTLDEKRAFVIEQWVQSFMKRMNEIRATKCVQVDRFPSSEKKDIKKHFKNVNPEERKNILSQARVLNENFDAELISSVSVAEMYEKACGPGFKYEKIQVGGKTTFKWPRIECEYHQDDGGLSGASSKFLCDFADSSKKDGLITRKVKYSRVDVDPTKKAEVIDATMASTLTRMIGFHAETYCLAEVICKNCPSQSPWDDARSSAPKSDKDYVFPLTMIEYPIKGFTVTNPGPHSKPQGMHWNELREVQGGELSKTMRIEREAWMLWVGVIQHWDADPHNQRILCVKEGRDSQDNTICEKSIIYTHDYGRSFYRNFQFTLWSLTQPMKEDENGCTSNFGRMLFNGNPGPGLVQFPHISREARDLLVSRLEKLTDQQLVDVFQMSKGEEYVKVKAADWAKVIRKKTAMMKSAECSDFSTGKSALGK